MSADAAEMPVKPSRPAMIYATRKISAHFKIVIDLTSSSARAGLTFARGTGSWTRGPHFGLAQCSSRCENLGAISLPGDQ